MAVCGHLPGFNETTAEFWLLIDLSCVLTSPGLLLVRAVSWQLMDFNQATDVCWQILDSYWSRLFYGSSCHIYVLTYAGLLMATAVS